MEKLNNIEADQNLIFEKLTKNDRDIARLKHLYDF